MYVHHRFAWKFSHHQLDAVGTVRHILVPRLLPSHIMYMLCDEMVGKRLGMRLGTSRVSVIPQAQSTTPRRLPDKQCHRDWFPGAISDDMHGK